ncbi:MAG: methylmalonyl Co-A mutase-associated GTPase MeaB, partial [Gammaproteobacteria bacterium]|nr:methylmalonyl Co-A mutase-associated GTPase MeaB [Gammaproteobacteria bacterium]
ATWETIEEYRRVMNSSGELTERRASQALAWMWAETGEGLKSMLKADESVQQRIPELEAKVMEGRFPPTIAARMLLETFLQRGK